MVLSDKVPFCPDNPSFRMIRQASRFTVARRGRDSSPDAAQHELDGFDECRMEAALREMETEMAAVD
jgi:hypothetical protein